MKNYKFLFLIFIIFCITNLNASKAYTGVYYNLNTFDTFLYSDSSISPIEIDIVKKPINFSFSMYKEDGFSIILDLYKDSAINEAFYPNDLQYFNRIGAGFSVCKVISLPIFINSKKLITPDISFGPFIKMYKVSTNNMEDVKTGFFEFGFMYEIKLKINLFRKFLNINSFDIGFKHYFPVSNNSVENRSNYLQTNITSLFFGVSF